MGVMLQAFYWNAPTLESQEAGWWNLIRTRIDALSGDGFTALWLPPASKAAEWNSMGYDPYDYFDLGAFDQKGRTETYFGSRGDLEALIAAAHEKQIQVYADVVLNHNSGADAQEVNPLDGSTRWTKFTPASGQFPRDWTCFHPSSYETMDGWGEFGGMPDLCHRNPKVFAAMMDYTRFLFEEIGFDGFRFDFVKGYGPWLVTGIAEYRYRRGGQWLKPFCVGECWDSDRAIDDWLHAINNSFMDNPVSAFDFPLHYNLKSLCDSYGYDLRGLTAGTVFRDDPLHAVTFVDNHDTVRDPGNAVVNDKMLAYAVILTHEGYPCVFWQDYFNFGLARRGTPNGIAALVTAHEDYAGGESTVLSADPNLYILQRAGTAGIPGLVLVLNNRGDGWAGAEVVTRWQNTRLRPIAWWSSTDLSAPEDKQTGADGSVDLWAAPRGYAVYAPF
jgi:alpha-amylase